MNKDEIIAIGKRLKKARESKNMTQAYVANELGVSIKHYGCLERGVSCISVNCLLKFRALTGIELEYLLTGEITNKTDLSFFSKYNSLSPVERQKLEVIFELVLDFKHENDDGNT